MPAAAGALPLFNPDRQTAIHEKAGGFLAWVGEVFTPLWEKTGRIIDPDGERQRRHGLSPLCRNELPPLRAQRPSLLEETARPRPIAQSSRRSGGPSLADSVFCRNSPSYCANETALHVR